MIGWNDDTDLMQIKYLGSWLDSKMHKNKQYVLVLF